MHSAKPIFHPNKDQPLRRIARGQQVDERIRGRVVVLKGVTWVPWDCWRSVVRLLNPDGSEGAEWLVWSSLLCSI